MLTTRLKTFFSFKGTPHGTLNGLFNRSFGGAVVILDVEEFETLNGRASFEDAVEIGIQAAQAGDLHSNEEALKILDTFAFGTDVVI